MAGPVQKGHATATLVLGVCELLCGILVIILAIVASQKADVGAGLSPWWAGVVFAIPGILGIIVGCTKNNGVMIAFMVLNIIAFVLQGVGAILAGIVVALWSAAVADVTKNCTQYGDSCKCRTDSGSDFTINGISNCDDISSLFSTITAMLVFLVIAAIIALAGSILGCIVVCCTRNQPQGGVVYAQPGGQQPPPYYQPDPTKQ